MRLSVVIPFYNLERYVRACLDSVAAACARSETAVEVEVICVDDGSTDATPRLLDTAAVLPSAFALRVLHKANGGEGSARNAGLDAATGDWVTFLDGDDVWLENHLCEALPLLAAYPDADMVALAYAPFGDGALPPHGADAVSIEAFDVRAALPDRCLLEVGVFPTFFRRSFLAASGVRFSPLPLGADRLFVAECLSRADKVVCTDAVVHGYRVRDGSMARAAWNARKVASQCDYAVGSLAALAASGKSLGRTGHAYLASLWLSDVPNRLARLPRCARQEAVCHWLGTLASEALVRGLPRFGCARWLLWRTGQVSPSVAVGLARLLRKGGIT